MAIKTLSAAVFLLALFLFGCAAITQKQAEQAAISFVEANVKFFARESENTTDLPKYDIEKISSYQENGKWQVAMHVSASLNNETKQNDLLVTIGKNGAPLALNGQPIPRK